MSGAVSHEDLMRYLDGELSPEERARVEGLISASTELRRDIAVFGKMKEDLRALSLGGADDGSVWSSVNRRLTRPLGWTLLLSGLTLWSAYGVYLFVTSASEPWEKLISSAIVVGVLLLLSSVIYEQYREWLTDPYRDVQR